MKAVNSFLTSFLRACSGNLLNPSICMAPFIIKSNRPPATYT